MYPPRPNRARSPGRTNGEMTCRTCSTRSAPRSPRGHSGGPEHGLTASTALAAAGAHQRALPHTFATVGNPSAWAEPPLDDLPAGDATIAAALALAKALRRLAGEVSVTAVASAPAVAAMCRGSVPDRWTRQVSQLGGANARRSRCSASVGSARGTGRGCRPCATAHRRVHRCDLDGGRPADDRTPAQALWLAAGVMAAPAPCTLWSCRPGPPTLRSALAIVTRCPPCAPKPPTSPNRAGRPRRLPARVPPCPQPRLDDVRSALWSHHHHRFWLNRFPQPAHRGNAS